MLTCVKKNYLAPDSRGISRVVRLCHRILGCPIVPWCLGIPWDIPPVSGLEYAQSLLPIPSYSPMVPWDPMGYPSSPRSGICLVPLVHPIPLSHGISWDVPPVPALAQTRDCWEVPGTGGMFHGIPRHYGTMRRPEVPVDILRQSWTTMNICSVSSSQALDL